MNSLDTEFTKFSDKYNLAKDMAFTVTCMYLCCKLAVHPVLPRAACMCIGY